MNNGTRRYLTPLWVIALFLTLTESVLGVAATQTTGVVQGTLTAFVVVFPVGVATAFFWILVQKPHVLYAPTDYGGEVDVLRFVQAVSVQPGGRPPMLYDEIQELLRETLASPTFASQVAAAAQGKSSPAVDDQVLGLLSGAVEKATREIRDQGFISVDVSDLLERDEQWQFPFAEFQKTSDFLDQLWASLSAKIDLPPYCYGSVWVLRNEQTGEVLRDLGSHWANSRGLIRDTRPLPASGLRAGITLRAEWLER